MSFVIQLDNGTSLTYKEYLLSPGWIWKRNHRRMIDGKCAICGSPIDLNVHHLTYKNVPNEKTTDLVTLCRFHHIEIEEQKDQPWYDSFHIFNKMLIKQFIKEHEQLDYSAGGNRDYCKLDVIKRDLFPYMKEHGANLDRLHGSNDVQCYFRNKRYEIILGYIEHGYPIEVTKTRVRFSYNMIKKVYDNPDLARSILKGGY